LFYNQSPNPPFFLALDWHAIDRLCHLLSLSGLVFCLHSFVVGSVFAFLLELLGEVLLENGLVALSLLGLCIYVVQTNFVLLLSEHHVTFCVAELCFFNFLDFTLSLLFKLIGQGHEEVSLPDAELRLSRTDLDVAEHVALLVGKLTQLLKLSLHVIHYTFFFAGVHAVQIEILLSYRFFFVVKESTCAKIDVCFLKVLLSQLFRPPEAVVVLLHFVG